MIGYLRKRLGERSTWVGLGAACTSGLGALASVSGINPVIINSLAGGVALCGFLAALTPSPKGSDE
jgi:hypothetical protein